ncbi:hypothetical protein TNCV_3619431 [Trichonephila clavipes]|nr:hypothetical protein TNCV_3619431 [Trichonephila clavipes]
MKWKIKAINAVVLVVHDVKIKGRTNTAESCSDDGSVAEQRTKREGVDTESVHNVMPSAGNYCNRSHFWYDDRMGDAYNKIGLGEIIYRAKPCFDWVLTLSRN